MAPARLTERASGLILQKQNPGRAGTQTHPGEITINSLSDKSYGTIPQKCKKVVEREIFSEFEGEEKKSYFVQRVREVS